LFTIAAGPCQRSYSRVRVPAGLVTTFYCLTFEPSATWRARSLYLYPSGTGWLGYTPRHWVPFSSLPTTRRAKLEVFDPASTREKPLPLYPAGKEPPVPIGCYGPHSRSRRCGEEKNRAPASNRIPAFQLVARRCTD
jgi:hypothetical protein